jgi:eukaryotic-like serine/threonine-protein kinase
MAAAAPKKIGKYEVLDVIGKGGMGIVYRAKDPFLDRLVAIKMMTISYADYPDLLQRFYREAKSTANLKHPNIVTVYELGEHEGSPYLAMEYLEGASLENILRSTAQQLSILQKIEIIVQTCHGLAYAHQRGIVHRDIKPGNIMVLKDGSVKIVDFGIARIGDTNFTRTGQFMGSLNYMSLEQLNDKLQVDQRTDVYSTGVVLFQFMTGVLPFEAESTGATLMKIINEAPPAFSKFISGFPPEIETITLKALAKDRDQRYGSADEFALDLTQLQDRLKQGAIQIHLQRAETLLQQNELLPAHDELLEVLKLDKQHSKAVSLLRSTRKQIEKEQSVERSRQYKDQAEEAYRREEFDSALTYLDQAIALDATNVGLQQLRTSVQAAKVEAEHLRQVLQRAENAHRAGNLDTAKQAIEEVLARRPNDTRVRSLYRMIQKELEDRSRQKRLEALLENARAEMSNRRYTTAFELLKEAETVDPDAPQLRELMAKFNAAREQEQRRRELEQFSRQIEQALNADDHQGALNLANEGLQRFPNEPNLVKLRDLAETQKQVAAGKQFVRERISAAREIINAGNAAGAVKLLEDALQKAPGNANLESLLTLAQERLAQERDELAQAQYIQQANGALDRGAYTEAIQLLEAGQLRFASSSEIDNLLRFAREQQTKAARQQEIDGSVRRAQDFLKKSEFDNAIQVLESVLSRYPDDEVRVVLEEARRRRDGLNRQIEAAIAKGEQFLNEGSPAKAVEFLQAQPTSYRRSEKFRDLLQAAVSLPQAKAPEAEAAGFTPPPQELDAPEPMSTMMWDRSAPPEVEAPGAPRIPTAPVTRPQPPVTQRVPTAPVTRPQTVTKAQQIQPQTGGQGQPPITVRPIPKGILIALIGGAVGLVLLIAIAAAIYFWPSAGTGTLTVRTNVEGVDVFVDNKLKGSTNDSRQLQISLDSGHHEVRVQKQGYALLPAQTVDIAKSQESPLSFDLSANVVATGNGTLNIQTNVDGVDVFIDNDAKRTTSGNKLQVTVSVGDHDIRVDKQGFNQLPSVRVHVDKDQAAAVPPFTLTAMTTPPAFLQIKSQPGAKVSVDHQPRGTIGSDGNLRVQVDPKDHLVEVNLEGYYAWAESKSAKQGETLQVVASLKTKPPAARAEPTVSFTVDHPTVPAGQPVQLNWQTTNANDISIQGVGNNLTASGSQTVTPTQDTIYTLTAKGDGGIVTKQVQVTVPPKPMVSISANPSSIQAGQTATLTWKTQNATQVTIPGLPDAALSGSVPVKPDKTAMFTIEAKGPGGISSGVAQVLVTPGPPSLHDADTGAINDAVKRLSAAYETESVEEVQKIWPHMDKKRKEGLKGLFNSVRALKTQFEPCSTPSVSGDKATMNCTQTISYTAEGKYQPGKPAQVAITLKKSGSGWQIENLEGK